VVRVGVPHGVLDVAQGGGGEGVAQPVRAEQRGGRDAGALGEPAQQLAGRPPV
jgi:hypothetical protein